MTNQIWFCLWCFQWCFYALETKMVKTIDWWSSLKVCGSSHRYYVGAFVFVRCLFQFLQLRKHNLLAGIFLARLKTCLGFQGLELDEFSLKCKGKEDNGPKPSRWSIWSSFYPATGSESRKEWRSNKMT